MRWHIITQITAWLIALAWLSKAFAAARGLARVPTITLPQYNLTPAGTPSVTVIVPARDESASIEACLQSLLVQDYPNLQVIAVDDRSTDSTGDRMDALAARHVAGTRGIHTNDLHTHHPSDRGLNMLSLHSGGVPLTVLHVTELPAGWLGKTHAMALAARHAIAMHKPDYLLFTDADVLFRSDALRLSLAQAVATQADHFVTLPTPILKTPGEAMLLGYLQVMGLWVTRPWLVEDPKAKRDAIGIGAFNLLRTAAYQQLGGFDVLRMEILEDLTLARRVKLAGLRQRIAIAPGLIRLHWAAGAFGVVNVMTKNLFAVFRFQALLVLLACVGLTLFCIAPLGFLALAGARVPAGLTYAAIAALYVVSGRHSGISPWYAALFPISAALFLYALLRSMITTLAAGGVTWRGTFYPLAELRRHASLLR